MRKAREASGALSDGDAFVTVRSSLGLRDDFDNDLSFHAWTTGDPLPTHIDHARGFPFTEPPALSRVVAPEILASGSRTFSFGPPVPCFL
jgi:hypothetical protein